MTRKYGVVSHIAAQSAVAVNHTGVTGETVLATVKIPANAMGINGSLRIKTWWSAGANNANVKTVRAKIGNTVVSTADLASNLASILDTEIQNRGVADSQFSRADAAAPVGNQTVAFATHSFDTTKQLEITFTAQLADGTDSVKLEAYRIELLP